MTRVVVDAAIRSRLNNLTEVLELCDESGRVLAQLIPAPNLSTLQPRVSEEELRRREQSGEKRYTTAEVLAYLEKL